jgi:hypothetical protein
MTATFHMCQLNGCVGMDRSIPIENKIYGKTERTPCDHSLLDFQIFHLPDGSRRRFQKANTDLSISDDPQGKESHQSKDCSSSFYRNFHEKSFLF